MRWLYSRWVILGLFLVLGVVVYLPAMRGPFQFDDQRVILDAKVRENPKAWGYGGVWGTRGLAQGSFWLDFRLWGEKTIMYHVENVVIHVLASWLVFILIGQILKTSGLNPVVKFWLSMFGGLVFLLHPVQTQAVAYISQRYESMAGMFYLAAVVLYLKARQETRRWGVWVAGAILSALAAMSSKEIAVTLPVTLVMMEWLVVRKKLNWRTWAILGAFFLLLMKIPLQVVLSADWGGRAPTMEGIARQAAAVEHQPAEVTRWTYLMTEFNVVKTYMRLVVVPVRQNLDYDYPITKNLGQWPTPLSLGLLAALVGTGWWALKRGERLVTLAVGWFLITLAVTSTVIPIRDVIYEHRLYLPMVGWVILLVWGADKIYNSYKRYKSYVLPAAVVLLAMYAGLTLVRTQVWASEVALWRDAWEKAPNKDRTNKNYGFVLTQAGGLKQGILRLERAVELNPEDQDYRITLGAAYLQARAWDKAKVEFDKAIALRPDKADGWNNLGVALFQLKRYEEAKAAFETALEKDGEFYMAWLGLGGTEIVLKDFEAAEAALKKAMEIEPTGPEAQKNFAILQKLKPGIKP